MTRSRRTAVALLYGLLLAGGWWLGRWATDIGAVDLRPSNEAVVHSLLMTAAVVYTVASAVPFVPGAEIGFALLLSVGGELAPLVYVGMVAALLIAYGVGRLVPVGVTAAALRACGLTRAHQMVLQAERLDRSQWLALLSRSAPRRIVPFLLRHRYLALVLVLNLPGNALLGGGGGIALLAGLSRLFGWPGYLAAVLLAVAPVPAFFALFG